jgi:hypothetical protein
MLRVALGRARPETEWSTRPGLQFASNLASTTNLESDTGGFVMSERTFNGNAHSLGSGNPGFNPEEGDLP